MRITAACLIVTVFAGAAFAEPVENPAYLSWKSFGVGTSITMTSEMQSKTAESSAVINITDQTTLVEVTASQVTTETQTTTEMRGKSYPAKARKTVIPRLVDRTKVDVAFQGMDKAPKEQVTVPAGTFTCRKLQLHIDAGASKGDAIVWWSNDVPGGAVKLTSVSTQTTEMNGKPTLITTSTTMKMASLKKK